MIVDVATGPVAAVQLGIALSVYSVDSSSASPSVEAVAIWSMYIKAGSAPYLRLPFNLFGIAPGSWIACTAYSEGGNIGLDSFGGMDIWRLA